jgi:hypothetical protein
MDKTRRRVLLSGLLGSGWVGLRALATGLPLSLLTSSGRAFAGPPPCNATSPQYLLLFTGEGGEPINGNVPGSYIDPGIYHPPTPSMAPTAMTVGGQSYQAARPWTQLPPSILSRTCFFHHATYTNAHGDHPKVNTLMGAVKEHEMLVSMLARNTGPCLQTIQPQPVLVHNNLISYAGAVLPVLSPPNLRAVLASPTGPLANLQQIRDKDLDKLNALFKTSGTGAQRALLDQYALSQTQARSLSQQLLNDLSQISGSGNTRTDLNIAAAVLLKMNVSPAVVGYYSFGGDNHRDPGLAFETSETIASLLALGDLMTRLTAYGLEDKVTIAFQNVFGRTLAVKSGNSATEGRSHNGQHHVSVFIGKGFKSSVIGGPTLNASGSEYRAQGIDSTTGLGNDGGDIPYDATLGAAGKTLGAGMGVSQTVLDDQITLGKTVTAALA